MLHFHKPNDSLSVYVTVLLNTLVVTLNVFLLAHNHGGYRADTFTLIDLQVHGEPCTYIVSYDCGFVVFKILFQTMSCHLLSLTSLQCRHWSPPLISQLFFLPRDLKVAPVLHTLVVFVWYYMCHFDTFLHSL